MTKCVYKEEKCKAEEIILWGFNPLLPKQFCNEILFNNGVSCELVNNECKSYYYSCSSYWGKDQKTCESIKIDYPPYRYCSYTENGCEEKVKTGLTYDSYKSDQDPSFVNILYLRILKHIVKLVIWITKNVN